MLQKNNNLKIINHIKSWLDSMEIKDYIINDDYSVDVNGSVNISNKKIKKIPVKFRFIQGNFDCSRNNLITLKNSPTKINGNFNCSNNKLSSLNMSPGEIYGHFNCAHNKLTSLENGPNFVRKSFDCSNNKLTTLVGITQNIYERIDCSNNQITSLEGLPDTIHETLICYNNQITSLEKCPSIIKGDFYCHNNKLTYRFLPNLIYGLFVHDGDEKLGIEIGQTIEEIKVIMSYHELKEKLDKKDNTNKIFKI